MDSPRRHCVRWTARAGILALALNALVPIHLAFDLGEELAPAHRSATEPERHSVEWRVLAALIGHDAHDADDTDGHGHHHDATCPVVAALGALTGLVAATAPTIAQPIAVATFDPPAPDATGPADTPSVAYRSRAPPHV